MVRGLYEQLRTRTIRPWLDEKELLPGQDWDLEIKKAVHNSDVVVVCLSRRSITKEGYVQKEIRFALDVAAEKPEGTIFVIPLRLEECEVPESLRQWHRVNLYEREGSKMLMRALRKRARALQEQTRKDSLSDTSGDEIGQQLLAFMTSIPATVIVKDPHGKILWVNPEYERLTAVQAKHVIGKSIADFWPPTTRALMEKDDQLVRETKAPMLSQETILANGIPRARTTLRFPIFNHEGRVVMLGSLGLDMNRSTTADEKQCSTGPLLLEPRT